MSNVEWLGKSHSFKLMLDMTSTFAVDRGEASAKHTLCIVTLRRIEGRPPWLDQPRRLTSVVSSCHPNNDSNTDRKTWTVEHNLKPQDMTISCSVQGHDFHRPNNLWPRLHSILRFPIVHPLQSHVQQILGNDTRWVVICWFIAIWGLQLLVLRPFALSLDWTSCLITTLRREGVFPYVEIFNLRP